MASIGQQRAPEALSISRPARCERKINHAAAVDLTFSSRGKESKPGIALEWRIATLTPSSIPWVNCTRARWASALLLAWEVFRFDTGGQTDDGR